MTRRNSGRPGFTIVELLVVIVVIAILAAITIVAYNGIQERAYNAKIISGVRGYVQALEIYRAETGRYPTTSLEEEGETITTVCLGSGYADGSCGRISGIDVYEDETLNDQLKTVTGASLPGIHDGSLPSGPEAFVGAVYGKDITDPSKTGYSYARSIQYALYGDSEECGLPGAWSYRLTTSPPVTACELILEGLAP